jgi:hypothetical protein
MDAWDGGRGGQTTGRFPAADGPTGRGRIIPTPPPLPPWPEQAGIHFGSHSSAPVFENLLYDPTLGASGSATLKKRLRLSRTLLKGRSTQTHSYLFSRSALKPRAEASPSPTSTSSSSCSSSLPAKQGLDGDVFRTTLHNVMKLEHARLSRTAPVPPAAHTHIFTHARAHWLRNGRSLLLLAQTLREGIL